jgi:hypothetical protein
MRFIIASLAIIATANGFSFFGKNAVESSDSLLSMRAKIPVAEPQELVITNDIYDTYVQDVLLCYDKNGNGELDKAELKKMFQSITDDSVKCEIRGA